MSELYQLAKEPCPYAKLRDGHNFMVFEDQQSTYAGAALAELGKRAKYMHYSDAMAYKTSYLERLILHQEGGQLGYEVAKALTYLDPDAKALIRIQDVLTPAQIPVSIDKFANSHFIVGVDKSKTTPYVNMWIFYSSDEMDEEELLKLDGLVQLVK